MPERQYRTTRSNKGRSSSIVKSSNRRAAFASPSGGGGGAASPSMVLQERCLLLVRGDGALLRVFRKIIYVKMTKCFEIFEIYVENYDSICKIVVC